MSMVPAFIHPDRLSPLARAIKHALAVQIVQHQMPGYLPDEDREAIYISLLGLRYEELFGMKPARPSSSELNGKIWIDEMADWTPEDLETVGYRESHKKHMLAQMDDMEASIALEELAKSPPSNVGCGGDTTN